MTRWADRHGGHPAAGGGLGSPPSSSSDAVAFDKFLAEVQITSDQVDLLERIGKSNALTYGECKCWDLDFLGAFGFVMVGDQEIGIEDRSGVWITDAGREWLESIQARDRRAAMPPSGEDGEPGPPAVTPEMARAYAAVYGSAFAACMQVTRVFGDAANAASRATREFAQTLERIRDDKE